jgi:hypothetical protein
LDLSNHLWRYRFRVTPYPSEREIPFGKLIPFSSSSSRTRFR